MRSYLLIMTTLIKRNILQRTRSRGSLLIATLTPLVLSLLTSFVLRFKLDKNYIYSENSALPTYILISVTLLYFLGLSGVVNEIIRERAIIRHERRLNIPISAYVFSKIISLSMLSLLQTCLYIIPSHLILNIDSLFIPYTIYLFLSSLNGIVTGLLISSLCPTTFAAATVVPFIMIPQILFGGAVISYEKMNPSLSFHNNVAKAPEFCNLFISRFAYEGLFTAHYTGGNNYLSLYEKLLSTEKKLSACKKSCLSQPAHIYKKCSESCSSVSNNLALYRTRLYSFPVNNTIRTTLDRTVSNKNAFLSPYQHIGNTKYMTCTLNMTIILFYTILLIGLCILIMKRKIDATD